ncbi:MAG: LytTR family DNA-binding domain-containing protein [Burkholderiales bacterium]|nr:LytTR family DNA-binding domain-containing protein [Burkholderiales bacterium]
MTTEEKRAPSRRATAVIAEDEPLLAAELQEALAQLWPELEVAAIAGNGALALHAIDREAPEVVFLDIEMPKLNGIEVARQIGARAHVVFITAYDQHALQAFEAGAIDYVLKPIRMARLAASVQRLKERLGTVPANIDAALRQLVERPAQERRHLQWITASRGSGVRMIMVDDISYFKADNKYTLVVEESGESLIRKTIRELHDELDPTMFWQIHRSTLINVAAIDSVVRDDRGGMQIRLKQRSELLAISEPYQPLFRQM